MGAASTSPHSTAAAAAAKALPELTLIVAATQQMGIGRNGALPWTGLRKEMAYFARVTKRLPPSPFPSLSAASTAAGASASGSESGSAAPVRRQQQNAVIMGRKTWESIPERFRPLPGRLNVVISRTLAPPPTPSTSSSSPPPTTEQALKNNPLIYPSLSSALHALSALQQTHQQQQPQQVSSSSSSSGSSGGDDVPEVGRIFVIGGGELYRAALALKQTRRVLLTRIHREFECDTFFPLRLVNNSSSSGLDSSGSGSGSGGSNPQVAGEGEGEMDATRSKWRRCTQAEMDAWVGEEVPRGLQEEAGTGYEFEMWERVDNNDEDDGGDGTGAAV